MKRFGTSLLLASVCTLVLNGALQAEAPTQGVDPGLPVYARLQDQVAGKITLVGSDTLSQVVSVWAQDFKALYPDVQIDIQVQGARNAVKSVMDGNATFGLLSRSITEDEVRAFHEKFGYLPTVLTPVHEQIGIYVHKDNPIKSLNIEQLDAIFSASMKRGAKKPVTTWGDLGLSGQWANVPIQLQGRSDDTGSQVYFQTAVMLNGNFRNGMVSHANNMDLVKAIGSQPGAIGFAGAIYDIDQVKAVPIVLQPQSDPISLHQPGYPLVRPLQIVVNKNRNKPLSKVEAEFIKYIFSARGQQDVLFGGFIPTNARAAKVALDAVGVTTLD